MKLINKAGALYLWLKLHGAFAEMESSKVGKHAEEMRSTEKMIEDFICFKAFDGQLEIIIGHYRIMSSVLN